MKVLLPRQTGAYKTDCRSRCGWRAKQKITLPVDVLQCTADLVPSGDWGQAAVMAFAYGIRALASW